MAHHTQTRSEWVGPSQWTTWAATTAYALGAYVVPTTPNATGFYYRATAVSGPSSGAEPHWPIIFGNTVVDGGVTWTCMYSTSVLPAELAKLDANLVGSPNAVAGSMHAPKTVVEIDGAGVQVTGPTVIARGGTLKSKTAGGWAFNDGDYPQYLPARSRIFMQPCSAGSYVANPIQAAWRCRFRDGGMQCVAPMVDLSDGLGMRPCTLWMPLRCHDKVTLSQVTLNMRVGFTHASLPGNMPGMRIVRMNTAGQVFPLTSTQSGADSSGWVYMTTPTGVSQWQPAAGLQQLVVPCDQNNVIDLSTWTYWVEIIEEQWPAGTIYPWALVFKQPVAAASTVFTGQSGIGTPMDGYSMSNGDRLLVKNNPNNGNGIFIANSAGAWGYASDLNLPTDFSQGMVIPVTNGQANGNSYWQAASTITSWIGSYAYSGSTSQTLTFVGRGPDDDETAILAGTEFFAHGNIFQSVTAEFTGITQGSPQ